MEKTYGQHRDEVLRELAKQLDERFAKLNEPPEPIQRVKPEIFSQEYGIHVEAPDLNVLCRSLERTGAQVGLDVKARPLKATLEPGSAGVRCAFIFNTLDGSPLLEKRDLNGELPPGWAWQLPSEKLNGGHRWMITCSFSAENIEWSDWSQPIRLGD